ncbi:interferon-induced protein 44-like [Trichomycterus rosablanca]|uniref:interferon-induced protein 44-like n=1 Tax=Trichomycterus rosablanca TaxID=2290929 RepID=UPI002F35AC66
MSTVTSRLSYQQEVRSLLNYAKLSLLYKASVHGFNATYFHQKCYQQGPTVTVAYNNSGYIFGGFISKDYAQTGQNIIDDKAFLFSFKASEVNRAPLRVVSTAAQPSFCDATTGPNFISLLFLYNNAAAVYSNPGTYNFDPMEMFGNDLQLLECEVYRVEGYGTLMEKPWRNIDWNVDKRKVLMEKITSWTPGVKSVQRARVLLVGAVGAGKSSFFNSIKSIFRGHVSCHAITGIAGTSLTTQFRVYSIKVGGGKSLPITFCDTMGLEDGTNAGLDIDDFTSILKGHIQDKYQFNPSVPLQSESPFFCKAPTLKEKIHTVVYVMDASKISLMSEKILEKLVAFRRKANYLGIPQLVVLTKVDEACPAVAEDLKHVYQSHFIHKMMQEAAVCLGVSLSAVVPVKNYSRELEIDPQTDILVLNAILQIIRTIENFFDDLSCDEDED